MDKNTLVTVRCIDEGRVGYTIPQLGIHRVFLPNEFKNVAFIELEKLCDTKGGRHIITQCLKILDSQARTAIENIIATSPEPQDDTFNPPIIPVVTEDDNGQVLTVIEGQWDKAPLPPRPDNSAKVKITLTEEP